MDNNIVTVRINLETREFEVKGEAEYVEQRFGTYITEYLNIIKAPSRTSNKSSHSESAVENGSTQNTELPDSFGEYLNKFPKSLSNVDKLLVASYYIQSKNENKSFTISDASTILIDQGVKLSNASAFNKANDTTKKVFRLSGNNFRVSDTGVEHIKSL